ncbi:MAG: cytochrome P450 [Acidobacteria bacterium]|nr:cytochrome P450 [Acidobacteriota bacterium]
MAVVDRIEDLEDTSFDPYMQEELIFGTMEDPYSLLAELRAKGPVLEGFYRDHVALTRQLGDEGKPHYMVLSYEGVDQVLNDPITFSNKALVNLRRGFGHTVSVMDPPEHTPYRKILQRAFRPSIITAWGDGIVGPVIEELVGTFRDTGRAELVEQFARPYPFNVIYRMLALPRDDIETFYKLTIAQLRFYPDPSIGDDASAKLGRYFSRMIAQRRADPGDDVVSVVATAEVDGEYLPEDVAVSFMRQLMNAGGDTTFRTTTALLTGLLTNPDQLDAVREDRSLIPQAVEEALRWDGPVMSGSRETTVDCEIEGVPVPAGARLDVLYGAANHDPAVFEHPERFDIFRERHRHFGFAFGAHNCLGQQLARLEMSRALNAVLDELPAVRVDPDRPAPHMYGATMRTPRELHVVFDPPRGDR